MKTIPVRRIGGSHSERRLSDRFTIRDIRQVLGGRPLVQELHRHDFFFLLALHKGKGTHAIDFTTHNIVNDSVFFVRPGQAHRLTLKGSSTGYLMEFSPEYYHPASPLAKQRLRKASQKNFWKLDRGRSRRLHSLLADILREYSDREEGREEAIRARLDIMCIELARESRSALSESSDPGHRKEERLEELQELLETHSARYKKVSDYAGMMRLSPYQLNAITKTALGTTVSELIDDNVILESKRYLLATSNQVNQIAFHMGYDDISYFVRFFKKQTGHSPERFRQRFR